MPAQPPSPDVSALIRAHRDTRADHRAALVADHGHDLATASRRLAAIDARLRVLDHSDLADQLERETRAGTALIVALTCSDTHRPDELGDAVSAFTDQRARVNAARAQEVRLQPAEHR